MSQKVSLPWNLPHVFAGETAFGQAFTCLVRGIPTPLKNMSQSVRMMKFPTEWKNEQNVPKHQPMIILWLFYRYINGY